jgi:hypothetical protein
MAKGKNKQSAVVDRAAEAVGHALGTIAGTIESIQTQHPHPMDEARDALTAGQETLSAVAAKAGTRAASVIKKAKAAARRTKTKVIKRVRPKSATTVARVTRTTRKVVKRVKKAVASGRKTARRAVGRLKR